MSIKLAFLAFTIAAVSLTGSAQTPAPVVVQAIIPGAPAATPRAVTPTAPNAESPLKTLQNMKAANEEILRQQAATLQQLEEIEKSADQIKVYSKRG